MLGAKLYFFLAHTRNRSVLEDPQPVSREMVRISRISCLCRTAAPAAWARWALLPLADISPRVGQILEHSHAVSQPFHIYLRNIFGLRGTSHSLLTSKTNSQHLQASQMLQNHQTTPPAPTCSCTTTVKLLTQQRNRGPNSAATSA